MYYIHFSILNPARLLPNSDEGEPPHCLLVLDRWLFKIGPKGHTDYTCEMQLLPKMIVVVKLDPVSLGNTAVDAATKAAARPGSQFPVTLTTLLHSFLDGVDAVDMQQQPDKAERLLWQKSEAHYKIRCLVGTTN